MTDRCINTILSRAGITAVLLLTTLSGCGDEQPIETEAEIEVPADMLDVPVIDIAPRRIDTSLPSFVEQCMGSWDKGVLEVVPKGVLVGRKDIPENALSHSYAAITLIKRGHTEVWWILDEDKKLGRLEVVCFAVKPSFSFSGKDEGDHGVKAYRTLTTIGYNYKPRSGTLKLSMDLPIAGWGDWETYDRDE